MKEDDLYDIALKAVQNPFAYGFGAGVVRFLIGDRHAGWKALVTNIIISMFVSGAAMLYLSEETYTPSKKAFFTIIAALLARDLLIALFSIGAQLRRDPVGFTKRLREAFKGNA